MAYCYSAPLSELINTIGTEEVKIIFAPKQKPEGVTDEKWSDEQIKNAKIDLEKDRSRTPVFTQNINPPQEASALDQYWSHFKTLPDYAQGDVMAGFLSTMIRYYPKIVNQYSERTNVDKNVKKQSFPIFNVAFLDVDGVPCALCIYYDNELDFNYGEGKPKDLKPTYAVQITRNTNLRKEDQSTYLYFDENFDSLIGVRAGKSDATRSSKDICRHSGYSAFVKDCLQNLRNQHLADCIEPIFLDDGSFNKRYYDLLVEIFSDASLPSKSEYIPLLVAFGQISRKAQEFSPRNQAAILASNELLDSLSKNIKELFFDRNGNQEVISAKISAMLRAIDKATPELSKHRGWKNVLANFLNVILMFTGIVPAVSLLTTGRATLFHPQTQSKQLLDKLSSIIDELPVPEADPTPGAKRMS